MTHTHAPSKSFANGLYIGYTINTNASIFSVQYSLIHSFICTLYTLDGDDNVIFNSSFVYFYTCISNFPPMRVPNSNAKNYFVHTYNVVRSHLWCPNIESGSVNPICCSLPLLPPTQMCGKLNFRRSHSFVAFRNFFMRIVLPLILVVYPHRIHTYLYSAYLDSNIWHFGLFISVKSFPVGIHQWWWRRWLSFLIISIYFLVFFFLFIRSNKKQK